MALGRLHYAVKLYRLTPVDGNFDGWKCSVYRGGVIVRAENEAQARMVATRGFARAVLVGLGDATSRNPWTEQTLVEVTEIQDADFSTDGIPEVLDPLGY